MSGLEGTAEGQRLAGNRRRGDPGPDLCSQEFQSSDSGPAHLALGRSLSSARRQLQALGDLILTQRQPSSNSHIPNPVPHAADCRTRGPDPRVSAAAPELLTGP